MRASESTYISRLVDQAPPLTPAVKARLAVLLAPLAAQMSRAAAKAGEAA